MNRRHFLATVAAVPALAPAQPAQPAKRKPIPLGIDTYSLRTFRWKVDKLLDYAEAQKLDAMQVSAGDFVSFDEPYLQQVRERATRARIRIEPGFGCICPLSKGWSASRKDTPVEYLQLGIRTTRALGGSAFRVFVGGIADRTGGVSIPSLMESAIKSIRAVRSQALDAGVKIAIENHSDMYAREVKTIIEEAGKDVAASCLDTGNPVMIMEDPLVTLETLAPYVVTTHYRDSVVYEHPRGAAAQWVALGDGSMDMKRLTDRFRELCPNATVQLEIITGRPPTILPYLEPDFWKNYPGVPANEFARYTALARRGHPFLGPMVVADAPGWNATDEFKAALRQQDRVNLDRSLDYARKVLDLGINWRA